MMGSGRSGCTVGKAFFVPAIGKSFADIFFVFCLTSIIEKIDPAPQFAWIMAIALKSALAVYLVFILPVWGSI